MTARDAIRQGLPLLDAGAGPYDAIELDAAIVDGLYDQRSAGLHERLVYSPSVRRWLATLPAVVFPWPYLGEEVS